MKTIRELRSGFTLKPDHINYRIKYLKEDKVDFDVYLPTKGLNLQRGFVWNLSQKQELIHSILIGRKIPDLAILHLEDDTYQIIDGKQRLGAIFDFIDNKFTIELESKHYFFLDLPIEYQRVITNLDIDTQRIYETSSYRLSDEDKISWFKYINFAGTPQDKEHMKKLEGVTYVSI